jgi:hypothetical protein
VKDSPYFAQAELLVRCLPALDAAEVFALKGGTAINLFLRDMPRLSVDIDLTFLPTSPREEAIAAITEGLAQVAARAHALVPGLRAVEAGSSEAPKRLFEIRGARVKVEPNTVFRGSVFPPERRTLSAEAEAFFGRSARVAVLSSADLYAGKLCAALDRSHPRDWFDLLLLMRGEGLTDALRQAFVVYVASHDRPISELLAPKPSDLAGPFEREFAGMARVPVTLGELQGEQSRIPALLRSALTDDERAFLLSMKRGEPEWERLPIAHLRELPALQWKLRNIERLKSQRKKHEEAVERLRRLLEI